ncbi:MAG: hypothetical protein JO265_02805 [Acidimicrobiia bacterium]|nr:hypothetical protein [Acidimicrobiia bacterium]
MTDHRLRLSWLLAAALLGLGASVVLAPAVFAATVPSAAAILGLVVLVRRLAPTPTGETDRRLMTWTIAAFAIRLVVGLVISHSSSATTYFGGDALSYHHDAAQLAQSWAGHAASPTLPAGKEGYYYELGGLYYVFGARVDAGIAVNAFLAAAMVPLLTDVTRRLFGRDAARYAAPLVVLLPGLVIWTSQLLREASVMFLIVVAADIAVRVAERPTAGRLALLSVDLALLFAFRANVAYVLLGGVAIGLILSRRQVVSGVSIGAGMLTLSLLLVGGVGIGYSGYREAAKADLQTVNAARVDLSTTAASGFGQNRDVSTPAAAIKYLPTGLAEFALGPFPWQVRGLRQIPALVDVIVMWALVPSIRRGVAACRRRHLRAVFVLVIPAVIAACMLALLIANFGTVVRERTQVVVLLIPIVSFGLALRAEERRHDHGDLRMHRATASVGGRSTGGGRPPGDRP